MNKKLILPSTIFAILVIVSIVLIVGDNQKEIDKILPDWKEIIQRDGEKIKEQEDIILFYGVGCPHCEIVDEFIEKNGIEEKVFFSHKEVYYNKDNANILIEKAQICGFDTGSIGIPFLWDGKHCFVGDKDIIEFFKLKTGI